MRTASVTGQPRTGRRTVKTSQADAHSGYDRPNDSQAANDPQRPQPERGQGAVTTTAPAPTLETTELLVLDEVFAARGARLLGAAFDLTGDRGDAEDLLQDAFLKACARPEAFVGRSHDEVCGWLWIVMRRAWRDRRMSAAPPIGSLDDLDEDQAPPDPTGALHDEAERGWALAVMYEALARLGPKHRTAMVLLARGLGEQASADAAGVNRRTIREWRRDARRSLGLFGERLADGTVCAKLQTAISSLADGEMGDGARRQTLDAHLAHCRHCRMALTEITRHTSGLQGVLPVVAVPATDPRPADLAGVVQIGQQTLDTLGTPRGLVGHHSGAIAYIEEHWRLVVSVMIATLTAMGVGGHYLGGIGGSVFEGGTNTPPVEARHTPSQTAARVVTVTVAEQAPRSASAQVRIRVPAIPPLRVDQLSRIAATPPPRPAIQPTSSRGRGRTTAPSRPSSPPAAPECRTAECLFGP
jgi:RNA polymerase sigma-70 factor, ECF subfamily